MISRAIKSYKCCLLFRSRRIVQSGDPIAVWSVGGSRNIWVYFGAEKVFFRSVQKLDVRNMISSAMLRHLGIFLLLEVFEELVGQQVSGLFIPEVVLAWVQRPRYLPSAVGQLGELGQCQTCWEYNLLEFNITGYFAVFRLGVSKVLFLEVENPGLEILFEFIYCVYYLSL